MCKHLMGFETNPHLAIEGACLKEPEKTLYLAKMHSGGVKVHSTISSMMGKIKIKILINWISWQRVRERKNLG